MTGIFTQLPLAVGHQAQLQLGSCPVVVAPYGDPVAPAVGRCTRQLV